MQHINLRQHILEAFLVEGVDLFSFSMMCYLLVFRRKSSVKESINLELSKKVVSKLYVLPRNVIWEKGIICLP